MSKEKVILAYSGGLDTSIMIKWIQEKYEADVITLTVDVGQGIDPKAVEEKALALGAVKHYSVDAKKEFVTNYIFPAIKANALYEEKYPLSSALSRPLIAAKMVEIAGKEGAKIVAHGCSGKGNDQVRFDVTVKALSPHLKVIAPVRDWQLTRDKEIEFAKEKNLPISLSKSKPYSIDQNLWGRSIECGELENPETEPPEEAFEWTLPPEKCPDTPEYITIEFEHGVPRAINDEVMDPVLLITKLNEIGGMHGIGRIDHIEDRIVGIKSREVYECPAATILLEAHKDLEKMVLTCQEIAFKRYVDYQWAFLVYAGLWVDPLRSDLEAFIDKTQLRVNGKVKLKLYKGNLRVVGRFSKYSLYDLKLATYDVGTTFDQSLARGFIELWGLQSKTFHSLRRVMEEGEKHEPFV
ncbi:MAG: argininosuccinate synthase [Candidatus Bathyarchaeota archaeon]|nr:argininosuccinate synthase [Candidatus Bathyarchaeota archaeon]MDW8040661.1 argininosuccinate synthase [Nitrososphaerota archaeon]